MAYQLNDLYTSESGTVFASGIQMLARLPIDQREAVVLRHRLGLSHEEMCGALGVPLGTVKSRLARALTALREAMKESGL